MRQVDTNWYNNQVNALEATLGQISKEILVELETYAPILFDEIVQNDADMDEEEHKLLMR